MATAGVRQFLDVGCGLPTSPAQQVQPGSVVVYVDNDELVMSHAQNLLARAPGVVAVAGDLTNADEILYDWRVRQVLDFRQPIAVVLTMTLHFFNAETARTICARLINGIAPGSYLPVSAGHLEGQTGQQFTAKYQAGQLHQHTREEIGGFLAGLELIKPGVTAARARPAPGPRLARPCTADRPATPRPYLGRGRPQAKRRCAGSTDFLVWHDITSVCLARFHLCRIYFWIASSLASA